MGLEEECLEHSDQTATWLDLDLDLWLSVGR